MDCPLSVKPLAHYILNRCTKKDRPVSNLHLQKILYLLQFVYCCNQKGERLLFPEEFHAWPYGPVMVEVYDEFCFYGGRPIVRTFDDTLECGGGVLSFINDGIDVLSLKRPWDLIPITHALGSPWHQIYGDDVSGYKGRIKNELVLEWAYKKVKSVGLDQHSSLRKEGAKCACVSEQICQNKGYCTKCRPLERDR